MEVLKVLILFFVVINFVVCDVSDLECIESFVERRFFNSDDDAKVCNNKLRNFTAEFTKNFMKNVEAAIDQKCFMEMFKKYNFANLYLKGFTHHLRTKSDAKEFQENLEDTNINLSSLKMLCLGDQKMSEILEKNYNIIRNQMYKYSVDKCKRKYFFDHKLINPAKYNIDPSAGMLQYIVNCEETIKKLNENPIDSFSSKPEFIYGLVAHEVWKCLKKKARDEKWSLQKEVFEHIATFDLTNKQREDLRSEHIEFIMSKGKVPFECLQMLW